MNPECNSKQKFIRRVAIGGVSLLLACGVAFYLYTDQAKKAQAVCGCGIEETDSCSTADCSAAGNFVDTAHDDIEDHTNEEFDLDLEAFEDWLIEDFLNDQIAPAMAMMTNQMNAVAMQYTQIIGSFMDAKLQMETQRLYQKLRVDAHRDYHISEDFCWFGTNSRSLSGSASKGAHNAFSLGQIAIKRQLGSSNLSGSQRAEYDLSSRWQKFVRTYCDYHDNNWRLELTPVGVVGGTLQNLSGTNMPSGLELACDHDGNASGTATGATNPERMNRDIDYTRLMEEPRTLEVDFTDQTLTTSSSFAGIAGLTGHEEDIIEMSNNLYGHNVLTRSLSRKALGDNNNNAADGSPQTAKNLYLMLRSVAAKRSVAQSSFSAIVGLKSSGTSLESLEGAISGSPISAIGVIWQTQRFMAAIMEDVFDPSQTGPTSLGEYIFEIMGLSPSYYSQLEILSKRIYQNPDFYSNLYDSSANVARKKVAMRAIELMVDREIYESQLRREMIVSVLLSSKLRPSFREANAGVSDSKGSRK